MKLTSNSGKSINRRAISNSGPLSSFSVGAGVKIPYELVDSILEIIEDKNKG